MPRATLTFRLPEEEDEHQLAIDGGKWAAVLWELDMWLRNGAKYEDVDSIPVDGLRVKIRELCDDRGLRLE